MKQNKLKPLNKKVEVFIKTNKQHLVTSTDMQLYTQIAKEYENNKFTNLSICLVASNKTETPTKETPMFLTKKQAKVLIKELKNKVKQLDMLNDYLNERNNK